MWSLITLLIAVACVVFVALSCKSFDFELLIRELKDANLCYLFLAFCGMFGFLFFESLAIRCLIDGILSETRHSLFKKRSKRMVKGSGFSYAASDLYFSAITPSASGGQPATFVLMVKDGIPGSVATVVLLVNLVMYTLALMTIGTICILLRPTLFFQFPIFARGLIIIGYLVLGSLTLVFLLLLWRGAILQKIGEWCIKLLSRLHLLRNEGKKREKLKKLMDEYHVCAEVIANKRGMILLGFFYNLLQRISQISVTLFCFLAIGGTGSKLVDLFAVQGLTAVGSNSVPIPGAMGAVDYLLINGLATIQEVEHVANLELMSRGISFYGCTVFSGIVVLIAYMSRQMKGNRN